ncbi:TPA: hypothetical protein DCX16_05415 [bacterium]|nr:hypothetical protein [bacterium]
MKRLLLFFFFLGYIIYPSFYIQEEKWARLCLLFFYIFLFGILTRITPDKDNLKLSIPYLKYLLIPFSLGLVSHLWFWSLPIPTLEDFQGYCGVPAVLFYKISPYIPRIFLVILSIVAFTILIFYLSGKGRRIWYIFFTFVILLDILVIFFISLESIGKIYHIFRHPPLHKVLYILGYFFFGIHEWVGNFIQYLFLSGAGIYVGKIVELLLGKKDKFYFITGFSLTLFFPTFFHFTNFCGLTGGELFFVSGSLYYFISFLNNKEERPWFYCMSIIAIGFTYERTITSILLCILFFIAIKERGKIPFPKYVLIPLIFGLPFIIVSYSFRNIPLVFMWLNNPSSLLLPLKQIYISIGPIISIFVLFSFIYFITSRNAWILYLYFFYYYIFINSTGAFGIIRHAQHYYLILNILLCLFVAKIKKPLLLIFLLLIMLYQGAISPSSLLLNLFNFQKKEWTAGYGFMPHREAMSYIKKNLPERTKIYGPSFCDPTLFYIAKYNILEDNWIKFPLLKEWKDLISFYKWLRKNNIDYVLLPLTYGVPDLYEIVNIYLCKEIYQDREYFRIEKVFYFGENSLFLAKVIK